MAVFEEMGVLPEISKALDEMDWTLPTDVQAESIPLILGGGDVLMAAETGSGKTGAFCVPVLQIVWETIRDLKDGKSSATTGAHSSSSSLTLSKFDRDPAFVVTPDGLRCQSRETKEWHGARATRGVQGKGKFIFETTVADEGLCRVGWSTSQASHDLGTDKFGFGYGGTGKKSNNKQFDSYGGAFGKSDVIGCCLDLDAGEVKFIKNGTDLGVAFSIPSQLRGEVIFPAVVLKNAEMMFNFGEEPLKYGIPSFVPICKAEDTKPNQLGQGGAGPKTVQKLVSNAPMAVILEPSRELAEQTHTQLTKFGKYLTTPKVRDLLIIGGVPVKEQISRLNEGVDIIVGTPGRLEDLISTGQLSLSHTRFLILDEADGLLKAGYGALINRMHSQMPKVTPDGKRLQMIVCSATLHDFEVKKIAERLMHFPTWVDLKGEDAVPETVHHVVVSIDPRVDLSWQSLRSSIRTDAVHARDNVRPGSKSPETLSEAVKLLKGEYCVRAIDSLKMDRAIIFCRTKIDCDNLEEYFNNKGPRIYTCVCLHGDRKPAERKSNLEKFKRGEVKYLICTDVAARGIDVSGLPFMINVTLPDEKSNYVHRIGRVGRAERMGLAVSLVSAVPEKVWYHGDWCPSRGRSCSNTQLTTQKGCCIWYNETQYLADIEEHLGVTIPQVGTDIKVPCDEFDGKVVYGERRGGQVGGATYHLEETRSSLAALTQFETQAQILYLQRHFAHDLVK